jgi:hypothetical protein
MAKSRETLEHDLEVLKSRVLGNSTRTKETTMANKKSRSATAKRRSHKARTASSKKPMMKRAKNVMGEMLTNAAIGAARGAAETVLERTDRTKKVRGR